jgi:hypothetical protein
MIRSLRYSASQLAGLLLGVGYLAACTRPLASPTATSDAPKCCQSRYPAAAFKQCTTKQLGREYQRLRRLKCQACDYYISDFHQIMEELSTRLNGQPSTTIRRVMGRPDYTTKDKTLVYYWRYRHDYLRFHPAANGAAVSSWYKALE